MKDEGIEQIIGGLEKPLLEIMLSDVLYIASLFNESEQLPKAWAELLTYKLQQDQLFHRWQALLHKVPYFGLLGHCSSSSPFPPDQINVVLVAMHFPIQQDRQEKNTVHFTKGVAAEQKFKTYERKHDIYVYNNNNHVNYHNLLMTELVLMFGD